jgi:hypothetical protein
MLLRLQRKRHTAWEAHDVNDVCDAEFSKRDGTPGLELEVSVYLLDSPDQVVRVRAEHLAGLGLDFDSPRETHADFEGLTPDPIVTRGTVPFQFARDRHRCVRQPNEESLRAMVAALQADLNGRLHHTTKTALLDYVLERILNTDPEWRNHFDNTPKGPQLERQAMRPRRARDAN